MRAGIKDIAEWLKYRKHPLICTHIRPDGDALGSLVGFVCALNDAGYECSGYISSEIPDRYRELLPSVPNLHVDSYPHEDFDSIVCLDTATAERADIPEEVELGEEHPIANLDHHADNTGYGEINFIDSGKAATASLLVEILHEMDIPIRSGTANSLLTGLVMDCGGFRFRNTAPATLRIAAQLIEAGADLHLIMDRMFFQEPLGVLQLKAALLQNADFDCNNQFIYAVMDADLRAEFGVSANETEGVIDALRCVQGTLIACLIQPQKDGVRLSLRSREPEYPVDNIARQLGGGGHSLAAGAELEDITIPEAINKVGDLVRKVLN
ncbi:MAG: bifunctional oligoribonuclease/PAP phosphatase NrnA [Lentisphaeria bacterium]